MQWKTIVTAPSYEVSENGDVRRAVDSVFRKGRWLTGSYLKHEVIHDGYHRVCLYHAHGVKIRARVHGLVMDAFVGDCPSGMEINHRNGDKGDNRLANLEYVTKSQNIKHAWTNGLIDRERHAAARRGKRTRMKLSPQDIPTIRARLASGHYMTDIAKDFGVTAGTILWIKKGVTWTDC